MATPSWIRLGQLLVQRGQLDRADLVKALSNQMVLGGRLGTSLVELELVRIDDLSRVLAEQWGVEPLRTAMLESISRDAVDMLSRRQAEFLAAVPIAVQGAHCSVAMMDPSPQAVARLAAELQRDVVPFATPELRLLYLLERHYGIDRPKRFLRVAESSYAGHERRRYLEATIPPKPLLPLPALKTLPPFELNADEQTLVGPLPAFDVAPLTAAGHRAVGKLLRSSHSRVILRTPPQVNLEETLTAVRTPIDRLIDRVRAAESGGALAKLLVQPIATETGTAVLFWVRDSLAIGCTVFGVDASLEQLQGLVVNLQEPSLLHWARLLEGAVRARAGHEPVHRMIAEYLGIPTPSDICVAPVMLDGKVVNLICVHAHEGRFDSAVIDDYYRLGLEASAAYERVRQRLREQP